jgi:23S rRNA pseudouridine1911/1915/1917 synthase
MMQPKSVEFIVQVQDNGQRIDKFLHACLPEYSRSFFQNLIQAGAVTVNKAAVKSSFKLSAGETVEVLIPPPQKTEILAENIPVDIVFEDHDIVVIDKPAGMVVHPGAGVRSGTLVNALLYHCRDLSGVGGRLRPGIVHRLDKNTSGLLVVAKNDHAHHQLTRQLSNRTMIREYQAIVWHKVSSADGTIETSLTRSKKNRKIFTVSESGRKAITHYKVDQVFDFLTLLTVRLDTGRTHQIRVHMNYIHHPVFGDPEYNGRAKQLGQLSSQKYRVFAGKLLQQISRQALHARKLQFLQPVSGNTLSFESRLPLDMQFVLDELKKEGSKLIVH